MTTLFQRVQRLQYSLNHDSYLKQIKGKKNLEQFYPCQRAICFSMEIDEIVKGGDQAKIAYWKAMNMAEMTICSCHPVMNIGDLLRRETIETPWERRQEKEND